MFACLCVWVCVYTHVCASTDHERLHSIQGQVASGQSACPTSHTSTTPTPHCFPGKSLHTSELRPRISFVLGDLILCSLRWPGPPDLYMLP